MKLFKYCIVAVSFMMGLCFPLLVAAQSIEKPSSPVKLIFIHHSCGGHWLADSNENNPYGGLGRELMENNYYASATNYGWGPDIAGLDPTSIGDHTNIPNWPRWFTGSDSSTILGAVYSESGQNISEFGSWPRLDGSVSDADIEPYLLFLIQLVMRIYIHNRDATFFGE